MGKMSNRDKILTEGLKVVLGRGYVGASVRDIVEAAGVPQGSFTNHFKSKETFALEVLDLYFGDVRVLIDRSLRNESLTPLTRLRAYVNANNKSVRTNGCLLGNFSAEATDHSEIIRRRLLEIYAELQGCILACLKAAVEVGELPKDFRCEEMAPFVVSGLQGAILIAKTERDLAPLKNFEKLLFSTILAARNAPERGAPSSDDKCFPIMP
jgi:TetR/AcrR family transcriptional repressor of nem operon